MNVLNNEATASSVQMIDDPDHIVARDRLIVDAAQRALRASGYGQLLRVSVQCDHGRVTLEGRVPTFYLKQVAQSVLKSIDGICDIHNEVNVQHST